MAASEGAEAAGRLEDPLRAEAASDEGPRTMRAMLPYQPGARAGGGSGLFCGAGACETRPGTRGGVRRHLAVINASAAAVGGRANGGRARGRAQAVSRKQNRPLPGREEPP